MNKHEREALDRWLATEPEIDLGFSIFENVAVIDKWIDDGTSIAFKADEVLALFGRVAKVSEECGEVMQALIGYTGQNPRKGISHTMDDIRKELADVILTALCAIHHTTKDSEHTMAIVLAKIAYVMERAGLNQ